MTAPYWLSPQHPTLFPDVELALTDPDGLLAIGGDLSPARLLAAYRHGIFPWYSDTQPILWWSPDPRSVLFPDELKISRSLRKVLKQQVYTVSFDQCFDQVIAACAETRPGQPGTWITEEMQIAYQRLHLSGYAHSIECWYEEQLVGGLYGIALGKVFFGESMFTRRDNASKVAFVTLLAHLRHWQFAVIDCQVQTAHLDSLGARMIPRPQFVALLDAYCDPDQPGHWKTEPEILKLIANTGQIIPH